MYIYKVKQKQLYVMTILINTPEKIKRTQNSINESKRKLNYELSFSDDLQKKETINFLNSHIIRLENAIQNGFITRTNF